MKKRPVFFGILLLLIAGGIAFAGSVYNDYKNAGISNLNANGQKELLNLVAALQKDSLFIEGNIYLYDEEIRGAAKEITPFSILKAGENSYSEIGFVRFFTNANLSVQVDSLNKYMIIRKTGGVPQPESYNSLLPPQQLLEDSVFKTTIAVSNKGNLRTITIASEANPAIKSCSIDYDPVSYSIAEARVEWWKTDLPAGNSTGAKCWITRIEYNYNPHINFNGKTPSDVVNIADDVVTPVAEYAGYSVKMF